MRRPKKPKPTFDVARTQLGADRVGWVYRSETLDAPPATPPLPPTPEPFVGDQTQGQASRTWIDTGVGVLVLPFSLTLVAMVAPMYWLFASRDSQ